MLKTERKLATIRRISQILPIPNADRIVCAIVDGWKAVIKKDDFVVNDIIIYAEIDSWIPNKIAPHLTKEGKIPSVYNDVSGERLKTVKLRGQISQGLIMPFHLVRDLLIVENILKENEENKDELIGHDVTSLLGIQKYDPPTITFAGSSITGKPFPYFIPKTDQERIQNLAIEFKEWKERILSWEVTEKIDGTSCTIYYNRHGDSGDDDEEEIFGVCSRNLDLVKPKDNESIVSLYWMMEHQYDIISKIKISGRRLAIQGEIIGTKIQNNLYGLKGNEMKFCVFDIYDLEKKCYLPPVERRHVCEEFGLLHVPVISADYIIPMDNTIDMMLVEAEGGSLISNKGKTEREGLVFKCNEAQLSFKCISNKFLLSHE
jgi:RNA ligase (TIGR02306 family)